MSKHEARLSLLSESSLDGAPSYSSSSYPPEAYHSPSHSRQDYATRNANLKAHYGGEPYASRGFANASPALPTPGGYAQREGYIAGSSPTTSKASSFKYFPSSKWQWAFLGVVLAQAVIGLALECYIFAKFQSSLRADVDDPNAKTVPTYLSLFIFGFIYQLLLVYDALRLKNTIQTIGLCLYNVGLLIEASVQSDQIHDAVRLLQSRFGAIDLSFWNGIQPFIIAVPCVLALGLVLMCLVTWKLYHEFAWSIYKDISADLRLKRRFLSYQIYIALLKFDFFFFLVFSVQFLVVVETTNFEFYITIAAVPITIIILFLAAYWIRKETVAGMVCVIIVYFAALAYFIFKLIRMYYGPPDRVQAYSPARRSLTTFAFITVLLLLITIIYAFICTANFNKGLKPHVAGTKSRRRAASLEMDKLYEHGEPQIVGGPNRITID